MAAPLTIALQAVGLDRDKVIHKPRLFSDNGSSYIAGGLVEWLMRQVLASITHHKDSNHLPMDTAYR